MIEVKRYTNEDASLWNDFLKQSKNGTFLFDRNYMSYHSDRFSDHSIMIYDEKKLVAILPANQDDKRVTSHGGLSYGGLVLTRDVKLEEVCVFFHYVLRYYAEAGVDELIYKCIPSFFAIFPSQEDLYIMYLLKAELIRRDSGCASPLVHHLPYQQRRKRSARKAENLNVRVLESRDPSNFWKNVLVPNLKERYSLSPVHTSEEMQLLMNRFPGNIKLFEASSEELMAGTIIYETSTVAHAQYIAASQSGKECGALDLLFLHLLEEVYKSKNFFSFGISNEDNGQYLNRGLQDWKEGWGGRTYPIDFYRVQTSNYTKLQAQ